jgi:hypothetical protein
LAPDFEAMKGVRSHSEEEGVHELQGEMGQIQTGYLRREANSKRLQSGASTK